MHTETERSATNRTSRWQKVVGVAGLVVVVWVGVESPLVDAWFADGATEMDHGPSGDGPPAGEQDRMDPGQGSHGPMDHG